MPAKKLLSIAVISRELNIPESTLHYWKNRFAEFLPSVGRGRQKRFRPEAVQIFKTISELLSMGHTTKDVKSELSTMYPLNIDPPQSSLPATQQASAAPAQTVEGQLEIARIIGQEIAVVVGEKLGQALDMACGNSVADLDERLSETARLVESQAHDLKELLEKSNLTVDRADEQTREMENLRSENAELKSSLAEMDRKLSELDNREPPQAGAGQGTGEELESVRKENRELKDKLGVLESELIRLRKDRREMEKFLLEKINSSTR